jgi:GNAT superfamily N-acetyltransferase
MSADVATIISRDLTPRRRAEVVRLAAHAVRLDADKIGWLPYAYYDAADADGALIAVTRNNDIVGFCTIRPPNVYGESKIIQTWVRRDARMIEHGRALVHRVERVVRDQGAFLITCWVGEDLDAMRFWPAIGFRAVASRLGRGPIEKLHRRRMLCQFARAVTRNAAPTIRTTPLTPQITPPTPLASPVTQTPSGVLYHACACR